MTLQTVFRMMRDLGVTRLLLKQLAPNDNTKNQIYLGPDLETLQELPFSGEVTSSTSENGRIQLKAPLHLEWLRTDGTTTPAPHAQLILYPQYPEVRLSGLLRGSHGAPNDVIASRKPDRLLVLGALQGSLVAWASEMDQALQMELHSLAGSRQGVFLAVDLAVIEGEESSRSVLIRHLGEIHGKGWISPWRLSGAGDPLPCRGQNCGGFTLEAELGIRPNSRGEPDYLGWEIKQHAVTSFKKAAGSGRITLMTPEPDGGYYAEHGPEAFVRAFGYADKMGRIDRLNFGGLHRVGVFAKATGTTLQTRGCDTSGRITEADGAILLLDREGTVAASWSFSKLLAHWNKKHNRAAFVPSMKRAAPSAAYAFGPEVLLAEGTDFARFLTAMMDGTVYYDPGIKVEGAASSRPRAKARSQFRAPFTDLSRLYRITTQVAVTE